MDKSPAECLRSPLSMRERRLHSEWALLQTLVQLNPDRLAQPVRRDTTFLVSLQRVPAIPLDAMRRNCSVTEHRLRISYPRDFPAVPMEAYLEKPVFHPNIHPETGFLCLWEKHGPTNTVEHAVHKAVAMLAWRLLARSLPHCMQAEALEASTNDQRLAEIHSLLRFEPLAGIEHEQGYLDPVSPLPRRRRLL
jgi:ubiquitin-protein ligase